MPVGSIIDLMQDMQMVAWFGVSIPGAEETQVQKC